MGAAGLVGKEQGDIPGRSARKVVEVRRATDVGHIGLSRDMDFILYLCSAAGCIFLFPYLFCFFHFSRRDLG